MHASVLRYFIEVARIGSVRKASERLNVAASAVNRQILNLEEELGTELFDRLPGGMRLNPAGERLLRHAQETLHGYQVLRTELDALRGERSGHVKLAAMDSCFEDLLPAALEEFSQLFPAATYTIVSTQPMEVPQLVASGQVDLGIGFVTRLPAGAVAVSLAHLPLGVVMPPGHPLATHERVALRDCAPHPFIRSGAQPVFGPTLSAEYTAFWEAMEPVATCNSTPLVKRLVMAGKGITTFSKIALLDELRRGELVWRPFALPVLNQLQVGIVVPAQRALPQLTQNFVGRLARRLAQLEQEAAAL